MKDIASLSEDAQRLLTVLPQAGRITNATGMRLTGWGFDRLVTAKFELRDAGYVEIKRGYGGPFGRLAVVPVGALPAQAVLAGDEAELYGPLQHWAKQEFIPDDFDAEKDLFEVSISANRRPSSSGPWEVPDLLAVSLKKYRYVPNVAMELTSFEVKRAADAFSVYGIFEAISHSKSAHKSYYCFECPDDAFYERADYQRIEEEARAHGIGLIRLRFADAHKQTLDAQEIVAAEALTPSPALLNATIEAFFDDKTKRRIAERTGYNLLW